MTRTFLTALASGVAGAVALTAVHQAARGRMADAPRMDVLGMRAIRRFVPGFEHERPRSSRLSRWAIAGDLLANTLYYAAVPGKSTGATFARAAALGLGAGTGALWLPQPMGLGDPPNSDSNANRLMTVAWYTLP